MISENTQYIKITWSVLWSFLWDCNTDWTICFWIWRWHLNANPVPDIRNPSTALFPRTNVSLWHADIQRNRMQHTSLCLVTTQDLLWCRLHTSSYRNSWRKQPFAHSFKKGTCIAAQDSLTLLLNTAKCTWVSLSSVCLHYNTMECSSFIWGVVHILRNFVNLRTFQGDMVLKEDYKYYKLSAYTTH